jgi:o-succinylbenzoate synthase
MTIRELKYFPFHITFKTPFQNSSQIINERNGFIISLNDELGNETFGECSPLPYFSNERIEDAERILKGLRYQMPGYIIDDDLKAISEMLSEFKLVPSIVFALEQTILSLLIKRDENFSLNAFGKFNPSLGVNAALGFDKMNDILSKMEEKNKNGFKTFKLKVGRINFEDDLDLIKNVRDKFGESIKIRLDANQKWKAEDVNAILEQLSPFNIQYIEEPCPDLEALIKLSETSPIPIAVDESIKSSDDVSKIINESTIRFIVLKPMILNGIISSFGFIKEAERKNINVVISSSFESTVGRSALVFLAAAANHSYDHGLDTQEFFDRDICINPYRVREGKINFSIEKYPPHFDLSYL